MPYIQSDIRDEVIRRFADHRTVDDAGAAAYLIAEVIECFLPDDAGYADRALAIGILETSRAEAQRQLLDGYEDSKRHQNGAVYSRHERPAARDSLGFATERFLGQAD